MRVLDLMIWLVWEEMKVCGPSSNTSEADWKICMPTKMEKKTVFIRVALFRDMNWG